MPADFEPVFTQMEHEGGPIVCAMSGRFRLGVKADEFTPVVQARLRYALWHATEFDRLGVLNG